MSFKVGFDFTLSTQIKYLHKYLISKNISLSNLNLPFFVEIIKILLPVQTDTLDPRGNIVRGTQRNNPVYKADLKKYDAVKAKYGGDTRVSGHSLGGSRAKFVSRERNAHGQAFNLGSGLDKTMLKDKLRCNNPIKSMRPAFCDKFTAHHVKGDALSVTHNLGW